MKGALVERLVRRYLLPHLPGFSVKGHLVYRSDLTYFLCGIDFESSAFESMAFALTVLVQPLYIPKDYLSYHFGRRLDRPDGLQWWSGLQDQDEATYMGEALHSIQVQGLPFLGKFLSPGDLANRSDELGPVPTDPHLLEAVGYSLVLDGQYDRAWETLEKLHRVLDNMSRHALRAVFVGRVSELEGRLRQDPKQAIGLLHEWRDQTIRNLRLRPAGKERA